jgi:hypothetical protein
VSSADKEDARVDTEEEEEMKEDSREDKREDKERALMYTLLPLRVLRVQRAVARAVRISAALGLECMQSMVMTTTRLSTTRGR